MRPNLEAFRALNGVTPAEPHVSHSPETSRELILRSHQATSETTPPIPLPDWMAAACQLEPVPLRTWFSKLDGLNEPTRETIRDLVNALDLLHRIGANVDVEAKALGRALTMRFQSEASEAQATYTLDMALIDLEFRTTELLKQTLTAKLGEPKDWAAPPPGQNKLKASTRASRRFQGIQTIARLTATPQGQVNRLALDAINTLLHRDEQGWGAVLGNATVQLLGQRVQQFSGGPDLAMQFHAASHVTTFHPKALELLHGMQLAAGFPDMPPTPAQLAVHLMCGLLDTVRQDLFKNCTVMSLLITEHEETPGDFLESWGSIFSNGIAERRTIQKLGMEASTSIVDLPPVIPHVWKSRCCVDMSEGKREQTLKDLKAFLPWLTGLRHAFNIDEVEFDLLVERAAKQSNIKHKNGLIRVSDLVNAIIDQYCKLQRSDEPYAVAARRLQSLARTIAACHEDSFLLKAWSMTVPLDIQVEKIDGLLLTNFLGLQFKLLTTSVLPSQKNTSLDMKTAWEWFNRIFQAQVRIIANRLSPAGRYPEPRRIFILSLPASDHRARIDARNGPQYRALLLEVLRHARFACIENEQADWRRKFDHRAALDSTNSFEPGLTQSDWQDKAEAALARINASFDALEQEVLSHISSSLNLKPLDPKAPWVIAGGLGLEETTVKTVEFNFSTGGRRVDEGTKLRAFASGTQYQLPLKWRQNGRKKGQDGLEGILCLMQNIDQERGGLERRLRFMDQEHAWRLMPHDPSLFNAWQSNVDPHHWIKEHLIAPCKKSLFGERKDRATVEAALRNLLEKVPLNEGVDADKVIAEVLARTACDLKNRYKVGEAMRMLEKILNGQQRKNKPRLTWLPAWYLRCVLSCQQIPKNDNGEGLMILGDLNWYKNSRKEPLYCGAAYCPFSNDIKFYVMQLNTNRTWTALQFYELGSQGTLQR